MIRPIADRVIVDPYYDAEKVGLIVIPHVAKNPQSQQGKVLSVGPKQEVIEPGDYILYRPYDAHHLRWDGYEYLVVEHHNIVAWLAPDGEMFPLPDSVMVAPDWIGHQGTLEVPQTWIEQHPRWRGTCVRRGEKVTRIKPGQTVYYPTGAGYEVGLKKTVWYLIKEDDILAVEP